MKTFNTVLVILALAAFALLTLGWHPLWGGITWALALVGGIWLYIRFLNASIIREARRRIEPRFVVSRHPKNGERVSFPDEIEGLVVHAPYREVAATVERQKQLLRDAGNSYWTDERIGEAERVPVIPVIFKDGKHVNETWEEFQGRAIRKTLRVRAEWHEFLRKHDRSYYMKYRHEQRQYEWNLSGSK